MASVVCDPGALRALTAAMLGRAGTPGDIAAVVAEDLVAANLAGHDSHGVIRVPTYLRAIADGELLPEGRATVVADRGATVLVSGGWGFGQASGRAATELAVGRARRFGVGAAALVRCNHLGRLGTFAEQAAEAGCVGMAWVGGIGGTRQVVPHGGARAAYGTNPVTAGVPLAGGSPFVLDFATSAIAAGKVNVAADAGKTLPPGAIVDRDGRPSTDPRDFLDGGALLPFGGHKGAALAVLAELLGQALTGADQTASEGLGGPFAGAGALFVAIDGGAFRPAPETARQGAEIADRVRAVPPAPGHDAVLVAGDPEAAATAARSRDGIALPAKTVDDLVAAAARLGLATSAAALARRGGGDG